MHLPLSTSAKRSLRKTARLWGIQTDYTNAFNELVKATDETLLELIEMLSGLKISTAEDLAVAEQQAWKLKVQAGLEPVCVFRSHGQLSIPAYLPIEKISGSLEWVISWEAGWVQREKISLKSVHHRKLHFAGQDFAFISLPVLTDVPVGYHEFELLVAGQSVAKTLVMRAPDLKASNESSEKSWGVFAPLYGIRSERDWGIGDLTDMEEFQDALHDKGASFFGTLPMLAAENEGERADPSPYSPVSRLFWNELFLDVESLAKDSPVGKKHLKDEVVQKELLRLRKMKFVDHVAVYKLKKKILLSLSEEFFSSEQDKNPEYTEFLNRNPLLTEYARFRAGQDVREFQFHLYAQFRMDQAMGRLGRKAQERKTSSLYLDFPVGTSRDGFDGQKFANCFVQNLSVGAPPDSVFVGGQNWGFAPFHPRKLRETRYQYFIQCLRHHMRYAGVLRLDHVMAFQRIYVILQGRGAKDGSYLRYHREEFFALLSIEAERAGVQIVGEDLGTVPDSMRESLNENQCLGMWVLPFESGSSPHRAIKNIRPEVLACLNTHDMVPWAGYLLGRDLDLLCELGILSQQDSSQAKKSRNEVLDTWMTDLGLQDRKDLMPKLLEKLAQSSAKMLLLSIEDLWGETEPQNIPGTWREYPNWKRRLLLTTQQWKKKNDIRALMEQVSISRNQKSAASQLAPTPSFRATYRLQLHKDFKFDDAIKILPYLEKLGVSHLYLSPILEAKPGSNHGYDVSDPTRVSEERGGEKGLEKLLSRVKKSSTLEGVILDVVPNHVGIGAHNPAWWDLLQFGPESRYFRCFDVKPGPLGDRRIIVPILGRSCKGALAAREISLGIQSNEFVVCYFEHRFPVNSKSRETILRYIHSSVGDKDLGLKKNPSQRKKILSCLQTAPLKLLDEVLSQQHYVLREWREGSREINYRRFFDINELAGIRIEDPQVYEWAHSKIFDIMKKNPQIHGLRIDHVDGLAEPKKYLERLSEQTPSVWVEKMLGHGECLPTDWTIAGSTGYEFLNSSLRLFLDPEGVKSLQGHYLQKLDNRWVDFEDCVYQSKQEVIETHFCSELRYLVDQFHSLALKENPPVELEKSDISEMLTEFMCSFEIYRPYATRGRPIQSRWLEEAFARVAKRNKLVSQKALLWLKSTLLGPADWSEELYRNLLRLEQLTGPVLAKGLEDTAVYRFCPVLALNAFAGEPDWQGDASTQFHAFSQHRLRTHPLSMSTSSTHDTKRSEDLRARMLVLTELSKEWLTLYHAIVQPAGEALPSPRWQYMVFETLIGAWPMDGKLTKEFCQRIKNYIVKASREAKTETSWADVHLGFEQNLQRFVDELLFPKTMAGKKRLHLLRQFAERCSYFGAFNSLSMLVLKVLSPGLPDFYQGCDLWDLSLVDPDNRRKVDFPERMRYLERMQKELLTKPEAARNRILKNWKTGEVKLWLTSALLQLRKVFPEFFLSAEYIPLPAKGPTQSHFLAFARRSGDDYLLVVVPRLLARMGASEKLEIVDKKALATEFVLPENFPQQWRNVLNQGEVSGRELTAKKLLAGLPVAILTSFKDSEICSS